MTKLLDDEATKGTGIKEAEFEPTMSEVEEEVARQLEEEDMIWAKEKANEKAIEEATEEKEVPKERAFIQLSGASGTVIDVMDDEDDKKVYCCGMASMKEEPPMRTDITVTRASDGKAKVTPDLQRLMDLERATHGVEQTAQPALQTEVHTLPGRWHELLLPPASYNGALSWSVRLMA